MSKIVLRRRFPRYICDGKPLGDDEEAYISRINTMEEFFDLEWVIKGYEWVKEWRVYKAYEKHTDKDMLMAIDQEGKPWAIAYIIEGELNFPEWKEGG